MSFNEKKWPGVSIPEDDRDLIVELSHHDGLLRDADTKDILLIAATTAMKSKAPRIAESNSRKVDAISPGNMNSYTEYKQYIALIYFYTEGKKDINSMNDPKVMVANFIDYARRGLQILKSNYLDTPDGDKRLEENFVEYMAAANNG